VAQAKRSALVPVHDITRAILVLRGQRVLLDAELASLYGVTTKRLNEQVRRNLDRFPEDFMFQLTAAEWAALRSQFVTSNPQRGGRRYTPYVFTEQGVVTGRRGLIDQPAFRLAVPASCALICSAVSLAICCSCGTSDFICSCIAAIEFFATSGSFTITAWPAGLE
jgi:ORF6N domain